MDTDTVIPAMIIDSGGEALHIGIMSAIMLGGASFSQLLFAPFISRKAYKKPYILIGISSRIVSIAALGTLLLISAKTHHSSLWLIFIFLTVFSLGGAFSNVSYTDILGKSINQEKRKAFLSARQLAGGISVLVSALLAKKILESFPYPSNYAGMLIIGSSLLLIASLGFWVIKETRPSALQTSGNRNLIGILLNELKKNNRLLYFLGFINTQGIIISLLPFVILYTKKHLSLAGSSTGSLLLYKVIGVVLVSILIFSFSRKIRYNGLLYLNVALSLLIITLTLTVEQTGIPGIIFILGGAVISIYSISMNGVLLELSGNENRSIYTGIAGAGSVLPIVFPLLGSWIISHFGFTTLFLLYAIAVAISLIFIGKIHCRK